MCVDFLQVVPLEQMRGDDEEDTRLLSEMAERASQFVCSFAWCSRVVRGWFGSGVGGVVAVFLFEIVPTAKDVDTFLWVVVGDVPPAYLVTDDSKTPREALRAYVEEMREWVDAVRSGGQRDDVIPVNVPPTREWADRLAGRLDLLEKEFIGDRS